MPFSDVHYSNAEKGGTNEWSTPQPFFERLHAEFGFTLDAAAQPENAKCATYYTPEMDGLKQDWAGHRVFLNPPYGKAVPAWVAKAATSRADLCVVLIFARTDTLWWANFAMLADEIRFVRGRLKFGGCDNSAPSPSALLIYRGGRVGALGARNSGPRVSMYAANEKMMRNVNTLDL